MQSVYEQHESNPHNDAISHAPIQAKTKTYNVPEIKVTTLRECPAEKFDFFSPKIVAKFWRDSIASEPRFNSDVESLWVFLLNTRYRLICFQQISQGTRDTILVDPGLIFRLAVVQAAAAIVVAHNHPSGDPSPSDHDIRTTRELVLGGKLLKVNVLDHIIMLSKYLDKMIYAECWIMPSWYSPVSKTRLPPDLNLG